MPKLHYDFDKDIILDDIFIGTPHSNESIFQTSSKNKKRTAGFIFPAQMRLLRQG